MTLGPESWKERAACAGAPNPEIFFPIKTGLVAAAPALAYCNRCQVREDCEAAGTVERDGIWGGRTERQRNRDRKAARSGAA
jgi:WhiB family redox-sensing transcriptional regulator